MSKDISNLNMLDLKKRLKEFNLFILELVTLLKWSMKLTVLLVAPKDLNTTLESWVLWVEKILNQIVELLFIDHLTLLLTSFQLILTLQFKWWRWERDQMSLMLISVEWIFKSKKSKKLLSYHLLIQNFILKLVLTHQEECFYMVHQEQEKQCLLKLLLIKPTLPSLRWWDLNSSKSI